MARAVVVIYGSGIGTVDDMLSELGTFVDFDSIYIDDVEVIMSKE